MKFRAKKANITYPLKTIALLVVALISYATLAGFYSISVEAATGDEVRAAKKIVSVVYDDSSSMKGKRWSYTNYSTQALIALLNQQDELYITYMSDPGRSQSVSLDSLQSSVNKIRDKNKYGGTPAEALDTAMSRLDSIKESDPTTQFWYIVLTDGQIFNGKQTVENVIDIQKKLDSYKNKMMSNSSNLNIVYMGMCEAAPVKADTANHLYSYMLDDDGAIVSAMREMSNLVSSRLVATDVVRVNGKEIKVTSKLPLFNISVLSQKSSASIKMASVDGVDLNVQRNISLNATKLSLGVKLPDLYGNAGVINSVSGGKQQVIPAGTYTIMFSDEVDFNNIVVQFEPAIGFRTEISRNGTVLKDDDEIKFGDNISVRIVPVNPGTDEEIPLDTLPDGTVCEIEYRVDDQTVTSSKDGKLKDLTIKAGENSLRSTITIPGFVPFIKEKTFGVATPPPVVYHFGIVVEEPDIYVPSEKMPRDFNLSGITYDRFYIKKISFDSTNTVRFVLKNDGVPLSKEEQEEIGVSLVLVSLDYEKPENGLLAYILNLVSTKTMKGHLIQNSDGSYSLIPDVPVKVFTKLRIKTGTYNALVKVSNSDSVSANGRFVVKANILDVLDWILILLAILIFLYVCHIIRKRKFSGQIIKMDCWQLKSDGTGYQIEGFNPPKDNKLTLLSGLSDFKKACHKKYFVFEFVAGKYGEVFITAESIAENAVRYGDNTSNYDPKDALGEIVNSLNTTINEDGEREAMETELTETPLYFKLSDQSNQIYRMWLETNK